MAFENLSGMVTVPASTGISQFRFVTVNTSGNLAYPAAGAAALGVLVSSGTTGSTDDTQVGTVQMHGVASVKATASTLSRGDTVAASSVGFAVPTSAGDYTVGVVVDGTSGGAGRLLTVALLPIGTT